MKVIPLIFFILFLFFGCTPENNQDSEPDKRPKQTESHYPAIYGAYADFQRMIRKDGFKLIVYPKINKVLLFDLVNDPNEMSNLSEDPQYAERVKVMFTDLVALQREMGDPLVLQNPKKQMTSSTK